MEAIGPNIFADASIPTLEIVLQRIASVENLTANRKNETCSAIRAMARWIGMRPSAIPAHPDFLRRHVARLTPAAIGVTKKRFANVKSAVLAGLRHLGLVGQQHYLAGLTQTWRQLRERLPNKYAWTSLSRFFHYCSANDIAPDEVDDRVSSAFLAAMVAESLIKDPRTTHQNCCRAWNRMVAAVPGWPRKLLSIPRYADHYFLEWIEFPASLREDVDAYLLKLSSDDPLDLEAPPKPLRPRTIESYRTQLRRAASALAHSGVPAENISSLAYIVTLDHVERIIRYMTARPTNPRKSAGQLAGLLAKVGKYWTSAAPETIQTINRWAARLAPARDGLTSQAKARLAPLRDERNLIKLFALPKKIRDVVEQRWNGHRRDALRMQHAVALSILTYCPLRVGNLAALEFDRHLHWSEPNMRGQLVTIIDGTEVKNGQSLSFPLPKECADLIRLYTHKYLPTLASGGSLFLFPGQKPDCPKRADTLSRQLCRLVHQSVGFEVNPHLYRHLVHLIVLNRYPGAYAMVSRVLGHKSLQTAISNYAGEDIAIAMRAFQSLVAETMNSAGPRAARPDNAGTVYGLNEALVRHG